MKVTGTWVEEITAGLLVGFDQMLYKNYGSAKQDVNALGLRVRRILLMHLPDAYIVDARRDTFGHAFLVEGEKKVKGFENREAAQRIIDKYLNSKITVKFNLPHETGVCARGSGFSVCKTLTDVRQALSRGQQIEVNLAFRLSLPRQQEDVIALQAVLPKEAKVMSLAGDAYGVVVALKVPITCTDPFKLLKELEAKVKKATFQ